MSKALKINWDEVGLGKTWDTAIAKRLNVTVTRVRRARKVRNIPCYCSPGVCIICGILTEFRLSNHVTCGKVYCRDLARRAAAFFDLVSTKDLEPTLVGAYRKTTMVYRDYLGYNRKGIDWDSAPLGVLSDIEIAQQYNCSRSAVSRARWRRGIRLGVSSSRVDWGKVDDLGKVSDSVVALRLGIRVGSVTIARNRLGISAAAKQRIDWDNIPELGQTWDHDLAKKFGLSASTVSEARRRRNIPPYSPKVRCRICGMEITSRRPNCLVCGKASCIWARTQERRLKLRNPTQCTESS